MNASNKFEHKMMLVWSIQAILVAINLCMGWWLSCIIYTISMLFIPLLLIKKELTLIHDKLREANIIALENKHNYQEGFNNVYAGFKDSQNDI